MGRWPTSLIESWESALFREDIWCMELSSSSCAEIGVPIDLRRVFQGISGVDQRKSKPIVLYDGERGIALKPMQGNWSSSQADLGYTELFHIPAVTSVSF